MTFENGTGKHVKFVIFGIIVLALAIAEAGMPGWKLCEAVLLAGGVVAVRELMANQRAEAAMRRTRGTPAYATATRKKPAL